LKKEVNHSGLWPETRLPTRRNRRGRRVARISALRYHGRSQHRRSPILEGRSSVGPRPIDFSFRGLRMRVVLEVERQRSLEPRLGRVRCDSSHCRNSGRTYPSEELPSHNWGRRAKPPTSIVQLRVKSFGGGSDRQNESLLQSLEPSHQLPLFSRDNLSANSFVSFARRGDASSSTLRKSWP